MFTSKISTLGFIFRACAFSRLHIVFKIRKKIRFGKKYQIGLTEHHRIFGDFIFPFRDRDQAQY